MPSSQPVVTQHRTWIPLVVTGLIIGAAFIAVYVGLQRSPVPHRLPVAATSEQLATTIRAALGEKVEVIQVDDRGQGAELVRHGDVVAAVSLTSPTALHLDYAGASGLSESGAARQLVAGVATRAGLTVEEADVVPLVPYDSRGLSAFYVVFGVTLSSFVLAQGLTGATATVRLRHRLYAMAGFALAIGVIAAVLAGPVFGSLTPSFPLLALALILLSAASAFSTKALGAWLGPAGIGLSVLVLTTLGNATSGATIGYDLLPGWARAVSGRLPPGAAVRAINDFGYFDGAHARGPIAVLLAWFVVGLALVLLRQRVADRRTLPTADLPSQLPDHQTPDHETPDHEGALP